MRKYGGAWSNGEVKIPISFEASEDGEIQNITPALLQDRLYGAAKIAHRNYMNLLKGCVDRLPCSIEAYPISQDG